MSRFRVKPLKELENKVDSIFVGLDCGSFFFQLFLHDTVLEESNSDEQKLTEIDKDGTGASIANEMIQYCDLKDEFTQIVYNHVIMDLDPKIYWDQNHFDANMHPSFFSFINFSNRGE